jgi:hypothetical protein
MLILSRIEEDTSAQGQTNCQGGEGTVRETCRDYAQEAGGAAEEEGEEE